MVFDFSLADCAALPSAAGCMNAFHILGLGLGLGLDRVRGKVRGRVRVRARVRARVRLKIG